MNTSIEYLTNKASEVEITEHLLACDANFVPPLSDRVEIRDYAQKIIKNAARFEAWSGSTLVGLVAAYCNNQKKRIAYITSVSVLKEYVGKGTATHLMRLCIEHAKALGMRQIGLEVASNNISAISLYEKSGFITEKANASFISMNLYLESGEEHEQRA